MIPGEYRLRSGSIELQPGKKRIWLEVVHTGDRPIQVGSHYVFFETNRALQFDRERSYGMRLDIPAGTAVRFEPGEAKRVRLVEIGGEKRVSGFNGLSSSTVCKPGCPDEAALQRLELWKELRA